MEKKPSENLKFKRVEIMKKSKFLKKSLATLLALMLVVAMIPVGAAADCRRIHSDRQCNTRSGDWFYNQFYHWSSSYLECGIWVSSGQSAQDQPHAGRCK